MASALSIVFGLLTFVTFGMIIGAFFQLAFIRRLEDSYGTQSSFRKALEVQTDSSSHAIRGIGFLFFFESLRSIWWKDGSLSLNHVYALTDAFLGSGYSHWAHDREAIILRVGYVKPEIISWSPRIILFHNFLSNGECDYLRSIALPRLQVSTVVDEKTGKGIKSNVRTSSGMFLNHEEKKHPMIQAIEKRISVYSQIPVENGEFMQILRYEKEQFYKPHHDYFSDTYNLEHGGQRIATMLMYLSDNVEGGETYFPMAGSGQCSCGGKMIEGLCLKPTKGDAVLFWSMGLNGESDPYSLHGACDVLSGEKWSATKWMRQGEFS